MDVVKPSISERAGVETTEKLQFTERHVIEKSQSRVFGV